MGKIAKPKNTNTTKIIPFFQNGQYYFSKGLKSYHRRDLDKAKKYLSKAIQLEPREPIFLCQLAIVLTELGEYQQSNKLLLFIIEEIDCDMSECHYFIANNYAHLGLFSEAKKHALTYMEKEPDGEFSEDNADLLELLQIESDDEIEDMDMEDELIINQEIARNYLEEGKFEEAIILINHIIDEHPEFWSAYNNLALAYFYLGKTEKAMDILAEVLEKNPGNLHALCNLLVFYYYEHRDDEVKQLTNQLQKIYPMLIEHRYKLGASFSLVGQFDLGYKWLKQLYKQGFSGDGAFYYWLSYSAYFTGRKAFSEQIWKKVIEENPNKAGSEPWNLKSKQ